MPVVSYRQASALHEHVPHYQHTGMQVLCADLALMHAFVVCRTSDVFEGFILQIHAEGPFISFCLCAAVCVTLAA